jgi:hypothetical protein
MMTLQAQTMFKLQQLSEPLMQEVSDFIDFILVKQDPQRWQQWNQFAESLPLAEAAFADYLTQLEDYEERLARGDIQW